MTRKQALDPITFATEIGELLGLGKETSHFFGAFLERLYASRALAILLQEGEQYGPYTLLGLSPSAPDEVVDAAYRAWAKVLHPDSGIRPDEAEMKKVNLAYEEIKRMRRAT